jgi:phosphatidylserine/phosphatidylglycerophosphate/cardiolipin synthase-like enzyme
MNRAAIVSVALLLALPAHGAGVATTCFTPGEDCTSVIVGEIAAAKREVLVQAYSFTSPEIVKALIDARKRGVDVRAILDRSNFCKKDGCDNKGQIAAARPGAEIQQEGHGQAVDALIGEGEAAVARILRPVGVGQHALGIGDVLLDVGRVGKRYV